MGKGAPNEETNDRQHQQPLNIEPFHSLSFFAGRLNSKGAPRQRITG
jgi:hypothetical protein